MNYNFNTTNSDLEPRKTYQPITIYNRPSSEIPENGPTAPNRKPDPENIRQNLQNAPALKKTEIKTLETLLEHLEDNQDADPTFAFTLLNQIKDEEILGTKEDYIIKIIDNKRLNSDFRFQLGVQIYQTNPAENKAIALKLIDSLYKCKDIKVSLKLINNAPENQKLELLKASASNSNFYLDLRIRELCKLADPNQKIELFNIFKGELQKIIDELLSYGNSEYDSGEYLEKAMEEFKNNEWLDKPEIQDLIKWGIESETEKILEEYDSEPNTIYPIIKNCIRYHHKELDRGRMAQAIACAIKSAIDYISFKGGLSVCKKVGFIGENPIQELLVQIAMNPQKAFNERLDDMYQQEVLDYELDYIFLSLKHIHSREQRILILNNMFAEELQKTTLEDLLVQIGMNQHEAFKDDFNYIFLALKHIDSNEQRIQILNNMFAGKLQKVTFQDLNELLCFLQSDINSWNQEEHSVILSKISTSIDAMIDSNEPQGYTEKLEVIDRILSFLYKNINDPKVHLSSIQDIIFNTKRSFLNQGNKNIYTAYLSTKDLSHSNVFVEAFSEVLFDTNTKKAYRTKIQELCSESEESQKKRAAYLYEQRLFEYYCLIIDTCYNSLSHLSELEAHIQILRNLAEVKQYYDMSHYINKSLSKYLPGKIKKFLKTRPLETEQDNLRFKRVKVASQDA